MRQPIDLATRELHVSRAARQRYRLDAPLFSLTGHVIFADFHAARTLAREMNAHRDLLRFPEQAVSAGQLNAAGLIDEILHLVIARHRERVNPRVMAESLASLDEQLGREEVDRLLAEFVDEFPPTVVYRGELDAAGYLAGASGGVSHRELTLEELLLLWHANANPAFAPLRELFDDGRLRLSTAYEQLMETLRRQLAEQPPLGDGGQTLIDLIMAPMRAAPDSLEGQLGFIRSSWPELIGDELLRVLSGLDLLAEEHKPFFGFGPGPVEPPDFSILDDEPERYSEDLDWMPRLVLIAKNAPVWLHQLSERHGQVLGRLDQIPDEELERLARWGFSGLWLIGVWERSRASARIKRMMGDHEAVASAYSLQDYVIADDLGGEAAFEDLRVRARRWGIRLATDMVPNHVGIDSRWVVEHPDWFISLDRSPFPAYSFTGADLSDDERVGIFLEDHYWDRSDAAVVFKRVDRWTGDERYIYHGNDGTSMPWNDTAQLDYRNPEVREAVIQTILHVARQSPIIRFDAAMTLTKKHFQRLWFPEPGSGGDIPSRAEHGMSRADFDAVMPQEFWREVVDRVAAEAPDTLLLAEAFWLLEGYFVRSLGMHRVYNSAFMNMLRDERNADYRRLIKETLEFDPRILKRYVNFMSNPDERTTVDQFGSDDKYFGVATMMATLPGLPMFGHGQIEGFAEKYGMEFRRPRWQEQPNQGLLRRHELQLFPLLERRKLFAEVDHFLLYDLYRDDGSVDENVFAYSNRAADERALVVYHNRFGDTSGWIHTSAAGLTGDGDGRSLQRRTLAEGLEVAADGDYLVYRDVVADLEYIRSCRELGARGMRLELAAYELGVFVEFRSLEDDPTGRCRRLEERLAGLGVPSIDEALAELDLEPVLNPFRRLMSADRLEALVALVSGDAESADRAELLDETQSVLEELLAAARDRAGGTAEVETTAAAIRSELELALELPERAATGRTEPSVTEALGDDPLRWVPLLAWILCRRLPAQHGDSIDPKAAASCFDECFMGRNLEKSLAAMTADPGSARRAATGARLMLELEGWWSAEEPSADHLHRLVSGLVAEPVGRGFLGINRFDDVLWFDGDGFAELLRLMLLVAAAEAGADHRRLERAGSLISDLAAAKTASEHRLTALLAELLDAAD